MDMGVKYWRKGAHPTWLCLAMLFSQAVSPRAVEADETIQYDCGVNSLFILFRLEGRPVTLDQLMSSMPLRRPEGYSMAELSAAGNSFGLGLEGVRFAKGDKALNRPAIAFFQDKKGGHFVVLRPVGATGTMVQVIDPPHAPQIMDYDRILSAKPWTGRILIPREPWPVPHAIPLVVALCSVVFFTCAHWQWRRYRSAATLTIEGRERRLISAGNQATKRSCPETPFAKPIPERSP